MDYMLGDRWLVVVLDQFEGVGRRIILTWQS